MWGAFLSGWAQTGTAWWCRLQPERSRERVSCALGFPLPYEGREKGRGDFFYSRQCGVGSTGKGLVDCLHSSLKCSSSFPLPKIPVLGHSAVGITGALRRMFPKRGLLGHCAANLIFFLPLWILFLELIFLSVWVSAPERNHRRRATAHTFGRRPKPDKSETLLILIIGNYSD